MQNMENVDWKSISQTENLSDSFIRENADKLDWKRMSQYQILSDDILEEFHDLIDWRVASRWQQLSEDIMEQHFDLLDWDYISCKQQLSEDFIYRYQDFLDWVYVSESQVLSEDCIREHETLVEWNLIALFQGPFTEEFILEFFNRNMLRLRDLYQISKKQQLSEELMRLLHRVQSKRQYRPIMSELLYLNRYNIWDTFFKTQKISATLFCEFKDHCFDSESIQIAAKQVITRWYRMQQQKYLHQVQKDTLIKTIRVSELIMIILSY